MIHRASVHLKIGFFGKFILITSQLCFIVAITCRMTCNRIISQIIAQFNFQWFFDKIFLKTNFIFNISYYTSKFFGCFSIWNKYSTSIFYHTQLYTIITFNLALKWHVVSLPKLGCWLHMFMFMFIRLLFSNSVPLVSVAWILIIIADDVRWYGGWGGNVRDDASIFWACFLSGATCRSVMYSSSSLLQCSLLMLRGIPDDDNDPQTLI